MPQTTSLSLADALQKVYSDRLVRQGEFAEVPVSLFVEKVDVGMNPLPQVSFFKMVDGQIKKFKSAEDPYSPLALSLYESVWIHESDLPSLKKFAEAAITATNQGGQGIALGRRMEILRSSAINVVEDLFEHPSPENIQRSTKVVSSFVHVLMKEPEAYLHLSRLSSHDPYTLQHSVGTAVNSIILGRKIGLTDEKTLNEVGIGGLLHDLGKVNVRKEVINKNGPLDELEWEEMRGHPEAGFHIVKDNPLIPAAAKRAILEHHEDKNGTGYPNGKLYADLDIFSKIVCISDIFNALTTNRSYSKARSPFEAFELIGEKMRHKIDEDLFASLVLVYGGKF